MIRTISLDENANPEYYNFINDSISLLEELRQMEKVLISFKWPKWFIGSAWKSLFDEKKKFEDFEERYDKWRIQASMFRFKPKLAIDSSEIAGICYLHCGIVLQDRINQVENYVNNYISKWILWRSDLRAIRDKTRYYITFSIAVSGWFLTLAALLITVAMAK